MLKKKGFSQVVSTVVLIALTVALVAGVLTITRGYVKGTLNDASACNDILEKVTLNSDYTCFDATTNSTLISISRNEFALDSLLVSVSYENSNKNFYLNNSPGTIDNLTYYNSTGPGSTQVAAPGNESGRTYCLAGTYPAPLKIQIAPKRGGRVCDFVDTINDIPTCDQSLKCS